MFGCRSSSFSSLSLGSKSNRACRACWKGRVARLEAKPARAPIRSTVHTSAGMAADLRRLPKTISFARSTRQALTRRCSVRSCALLAYACGTIAANRSINALGDADGSAINQPSMVGHASAKGSTRVFHQCVAVGCLRCVGRASPSFHAEVKLARKTARSDSISNSLV